MIIVSMNSQHTMYLDIHVDTHIICIEIVIAKVPGVLFYSKDAQACYEFRGYIIKSNLHTPFLLI